MALLARGASTARGASSPFAAALDNPYGLSSKRAAEEAAAAYYRATGAQTFIYRLPNHLPKTLGRR